MDGLEPVARERSPELEEVERQQAELTREEAYQRLIEKAQRKCSQQALDLQAFGIQPLHVAGLYLGAALGVIEIAFGAEKRREYLVGLVAELLEEPDPDGFPAPVGRA